MAAVAIKSAVGIIAPNMQSDPNVEHDVMAAVFRHIVARYIPRLAAPPKFLFLAVGEHGKPVDPPAKLLDKLKSEAIPVKPFRAAMIEAGKFVDRDSHAPSPVIQLSSIEWNGEQAIVPGKAFLTKDRVNYAAHKYVVALKDGKWTVFGQQTGY